MKGFYFGAHNRVSDNIIESAKEIRDAGGNIIQIFLTPPGSRNIADKKIDEYNRVKSFIQKNGMQIVVHSSYMHNLSRQWDKYSWWLKNFILEIKYAHQIGAFGIVLHFGKRLDLTLEEAYNNMYTSLIYVLQRTKEFKDVKVLLETPTGQGSEICYKLEDLAHFYRKFSKNPNREIRDRVKLCVDSCHIFSAGYKIRTRDEVKMFLEAFEELIGIRHINLIHLNDCKVDVGSQVDRHHNIGKGFIGETGLRVFFNYFRKLKVPIVLETPDNGYEWEIPKLLSK